MNSAGGNADLYASELASIESRLDAAMHAFAAGDALGIAFEGARPADIPTQDALTSRLWSREDWPAGSTSDDTAQLFLVAEHLIAHRGRVEPADFLGELDKRLECVHGIGPTTRAAIRRFRRGGSLRARSGTTNGALMRCHPVGWARPWDDVSRERIEALTATTHGGSLAIACAAGVARMADASLRCQRGTELVDQCLAEMRRWKPSISSDNIRALEVAASSAWIAPAHGVGMEADATLAAIIHILSGDLGLRESLIAAVMLGGDTDTTAAIAGGIVGTIYPEEVRELAWLDQVRLPEGYEVSRLARGLAELRLTALNDT